MRLVGRREEWLMLLLAAACLGFAWVFAKVGSEVLEGELLRFDLAFRQWMLENRSPAGMTFFRAVTLLGSKEVLIPAAALVAWRLFRGSLALVVLVGFCGLATGEFVAILKRSFHVTRPAAGVAAHLSFSFPSGHATGSAAIAFVLMYISIRKRIRPKLVVPACAITALLVGFSRLYLDLHWLSDIAGGWLIGTAFGVGCCAIYEWMDRRQATSSALTTKYAAR